MEHSFFINTINYCHVCHVEEHPTHILEKHGEGQEIGIKRLTYIDKNYNDGQISTFILPSLLTSNKSLSA